MRGLFIGDDGLRYRTDLPEPAPLRGGDEVEVAVRTVGVCATDLALLDGYMDFRGVPGHEFVGVAQSGPLQGRRVVGEINAGCGMCLDCRRGDSRHCAARSVLGILGRSGAFAERLRLPAENLVAVPDEVSDDAACFVEPWAAAWHITEAVPLAGRRCAVVGDGRLGLLCAWAARLADADVAVFGRHEGHQALLPPDATWRGPLEGRRPDGAAGYDVVVEATGRGAVLEHAISWVRPRGTLVLKTTSAAAAPLNLWEVVVNEVQVVGSRCGRFAPALAWLARGAVPVERLVSARFDLSAGAAAFAAAQKRGGLKVLVDVAERPV